VDNTQRYTVKDGNRIISFDGVLLSEVSSRWGDKVRWSEFALYKAVGDHYVLSKIGRSVLCHMEGCPDTKPGLPRFQTEHIGLDPDDDGFEYCDCVPDEYDYTQLLVERSWNYACLSTDMGDIIHQLFRKKDGSRLVTKIGLSLLEKAAEKDGNVGLALKTLF
jgi:hypothetical protein